MTEPLIRLFGKGQTEEILYKYKLYYIYPLLNILYLSQSHFIQKNCFFFYEILEKLAK